MTELPPGLWTMQVIGQYVQPSGRPQRGYVLFTPVPTAVAATPDGTPVTIVLQASRLDIDADGFIESVLLNPNDPGIRPGPATGEKWMYHVQETFQMGPVIDWWLNVPSDVGDGDPLDLAKVSRHNQTVARPADWFPRHLIDTSVQAGRISPRSGPLLRNLDASSGS